MCNRSVTILGKICIEFKTEKYKTEEYEKIYIDFIDYGFRIGF
jgi:hypothetical protein